MIARSGQQPMTADSLAARLRALREHGVKRLTQKDLARALGRTEPLTDAAISTWENPASSRIPSEHRLAAYARLYCTPRSFESQTPRLLGDAELSDEERRREAQLYGELLALRARARSDGTTDVAEQPARSIWSVPEGEAISIVCSETRRPPPYAHPDDPNYIRVARFGDLDTLLEVFGQVRADNPASKVRLLPGRSYRGDLATTHLIAIGGIALNFATNALFRRYDIPVVQETDKGQETDKEDWFRCGQGREAEEFGPTFEDTVLTEDVGFFLHGPHPDVPGRKVTICSGATTRGVHGAALCFIDPIFKENNERYIADNFPPDTTFCILMRVRVVNLEPVPPDLTRDDVRLYEWSQKGRAASLAIRAGVRR